MKSRIERWKTLLESAELFLPRYLEMTSGLSHESKGIRRSELFFFYAVTTPLAPKRIVESGRARAQSTLVLARLFPKALVVSLESDSRSPDVAIAAERLQAEANVDCRFGDSLRLLPSMVEAGDVVLIDGPKDFRALKLAFRLLRTGRPGAVFVHDLWPGQPARDFVDRHAASALLSDEPRWVERYAALDSSKPLPGPAPPGFRRVYGATLACFLAGEENYETLLWRCAAAQGADRLRENMRKLRGGRAEISRPGDFTPLPIRPGKNATPPASP